MDPHRQPALPNIQQTARVRSNFSDGFDGYNDSGSEDDDTHGLVINGPSKQRKISEKKRADNAIFEHWIEKNHSELSKGPQKPVSDGQFGRPWADKGGKRIIDRAREYQVELYERAKHQNTIAVLDTGSGKTLIAALLLRWIIEQELEDRAQGQPKRIAFFLVDKVALVFQQHAVLSCNLDYPIEKLCGELVSSQHTKAYWDMILEENMAVVCTAEILNQCLHHSFLRMEQINLLVFDEAHHAKKDHPYARIIKDFYAKDEEEERRPRILGMTASPVDAKRDPLIASAELEGLLHSRIATTDDPTAAKNSILEEWVEYSPLPPPFQTALHCRLFALLGGHELFQKPFTSSMKITGHLGPWCADRFWQLFFAQGDVLKIEVKTERNLLKGFTDNEVLDSRLNQVRDGRALVDNYQLKAVKLDEEYLSSKVIELVNLLRKYFAKENTSARCIVFVQERNTAVLLADLLRQPGLRIRGLEVGILVGGGRTDGGPSKKISFRDQAATILQFRRGELNCLLATSVAEEGLDIPDCNVIIRFDMGATLIQYIQSRGRARQDNSVYIHMIERGNREHKKKSVENEVQEKLLRQLCTALPEDRKLTGNDFNLDYFLKKERSQRVYTVPSSGAKLTYKQSLICLATFTASLSPNSDISLLPDYVVVPAGGGFQCEVIMPQCSPVKHVIGKIHSSKAVAKCSAAFEMCLRLIKGRYLDEHLRPTFMKRIHAMRNARLAVSSKKTDQYSMRIRSEIWATLGQPAHLFAMVLTLSNPEVLPRDSIPLILLSREPIPQVAPFRLFYGADQTTAVSCVPVLKPLRISAIDLDGLTIFTLKIFQDIFSKEYEPEKASEKLPYFLAPASGRHGQDFSRTDDVRTIINWEVVERVRSTPAVEYKFENEPEEFFKDKYLTDPWDGSRKFYSLGRRYDMRPTDQVPDGVVPPGHRSWRDVGQKRDILNYSVSLWSKSRAKCVWKEDQPVVAAELLSVRRNLLDDSIRAEDMAPKQCFLILEPLMISPLPVDVVSMAYNLPAIIHRIDSNLVAMDACKMLGLDIRPSLALEALTKDSDNTDDHGTEQINFQHGMGNNYERLELLGDSFLKMATTISVFTLIPESNEADLHTERMLLICNQNLFNHALEVNLQEYIRSKALNRRTWYPSNLQLKRGKHATTESGHTLGDKTIADVCEALIGAAYLTTRGSEHPLDMAVRAVKVMVANKNHPMTRYAEYHASYRKPEWQTRPATSPQLEMAKRFREHMGYTFKDPALLRSAFMHSTYGPMSFERIPTYQRLEFLGDALLDMACVDYLFTNFPTKDPQWLTEHKMAMVSNQFLGCLSVSLGFHKALLHASSSFQRDIPRYVEEITMALALAQEDAERDGRPASTYARDYWVQCSSPPKCLPDVVEAYVGAIFIDSGYDYAPVQAFFDTHVQPYFADMGAYDTFASKHPMTFLSHQMQSKFHCTEWRTMSQELAPATALDELADRVTTSSGDGTVRRVVSCIMVHGTVFASATSVSGRYGKIAAAKKALGILQDLSPGEFRLKHGCRCSAGETGGNVAVNAEAHGTAI
ncbi:dicer-like protein 1 [Thozetella sp. PMI_491]|nr:dicer-like protein 1 [Thozetella sp. PMI_491]